LCAKKIGLEKLIMLSYSAEKSMVQGSESILADALEAIIAAIYLDAGIESAKKFIVNSLLPIEMNFSVMKDTNYKSILLEKVQSNGNEAPKYTVIEETGPSHDRVYNVGVHVNEILVATGSGKNKKQAEQSAAKNALDSKNQFLDS
jgi:ribonuclease-3